ncbi:MAG: hypothetical protein V5A44_06790 [Haloarculaceae archaeon]
MSADDGSPGYDPGYDASADPHGPDVGNEGTELRYRDLPHRFREAETLSELVATIRAYGWPPVAVSLVVYGVSRGLFEYLSSPFSIANSYVFEAWPAALGINVLFGLFFAGFSWFLYFGVIGAFAGFFAEGTAIDTGVFKTGGYLLLVFVPLLAISGLLAATIPAAVAAGGGGSPRAAIEVQRSLDATVQMRVAGFLLAAGWVVVGFLLIPFVAELYDVSRKASVVSVLPPTLLAVLGTVLA